MVTPTPRPTDDGLYLVRVVLHLMTRLLSVGG